MQTDVRKGVGLKMIIQQYNHNKDNKTPMENTLFSGFCERLLVAEKVFEKKI